MGVKKLFTSAAILAAMAAANLASAQQLHQQEPGTNYGMTAPHDSSDLPFSKARIVMPKRVAHVEPQGSFDWELAEYSQNDSIETVWYNATVPGTVLTTLVNQGVYPDPYFGVNNMVIPEDLCRKEWIYRTGLKLSPEQLAKGKLELLFNGINYRADVIFNGTQLGTIEGAFIRGRFDITKLAKDENEILVHIYPPYHPGIPHEQSSKTGRGPNGGVLCLDGPTFISSEGWDWVPGVRDRNIGIWQDVQLIESEGLTIGDTQVITDLPLPSVDRAEITVETSVTNATSADAKAVVTATIAGKKVTKKVNVKAGETAAVILKTTIKNPKLWWPNGYGEQNLYDCKVELASGKSVSDVQTTRFGVRELSYEMTVADRKKAQRVEFNPLALRAAGHTTDIFDNHLLMDVGDGVCIPSLRKGAKTSELTSLPEDGMGPYLVIKCNGVRIYCKGGNWGMDDMMKNCSREKLEPYMKLHKEAGFTMVRNWTGESTEESFFELCDEYGMLVWNDFWLSTEGYNLDVLDEDLWMRNVTDVVRRFRNHPSIAIWCPRNEGYAPETLEARLTAMIAEEDGTRHYHPNSRYTNLRPSGDWHYYTDAARYFRERAKGFNTEQGSPSVPSARTIRKFMAPEDCWPIGEVWRYHDLHPETETYVASVSSLYGEATGLEDFCKKAQMINYDSYRAMFESWNSRLWNNTSGMLLWMSHPAWPSVEWQSYSWDCETFGSWFGSKKACEPLHVQMNLDDQRVCVVNNTLAESGKLSAKVEFYTLRGEKIKGGLKKSVTAAANAVTYCGKVKLPACNGVYVARVTLTQKKKTISVNDYILRGEGVENFTELNDLPVASIRIRKLSEGKVEVCNLNKEAMAIAVKLSQGAAIFSDGYINLFPGECRTLEYKGGEGDSFTLEGYNVREVLSSAKPLTLKMVDPDATEETKALYANLFLMPQKGVMFGHHDFPSYGVGWKGDPGRSDVKDVCGDHPAVYSLDMHNITDQKIENIKEVYRHGGMSMLVWHQDNPLTMGPGKKYPAGTAWDRTRCVDQILIDGSDLNILYKKRLDKVADALHRMVDDNGKPIPVIFRPLHEHSQKWPWWGTEATSEDEFIAFWRFIVSYLRDEKGCHNVIYAISPQMDEVYKDAKGRILGRWPGDDWVDFIGIDCYHMRWRSAFGANVKALSEVGEMKQKPVGVSETGMEKDHIVDYWTTNCLPYLVGQRAAFVVAWRNEKPTHAYGPYPSAVDADDFKLFHDDPATIFQSDVPALYVMPENITVK